MPYIGKSPEFGIRSRFIFDATASQTSFSGSDVNGITLTYTDTAYMDVFQNGVLLKAATDYTATTGTSVVLETGASVNDVVSMIIYDIFTVGDTVSAGSGGNFGGNVGMGGTLAVTGVTTGTIIKGTTSLQTPLIEFTDGDDAIAIADGGIITIKNTSSVVQGEGSNTTIIAQGLTKCWVNFNGVGTIAARDSFNMTSLTDNGTGDYTTTFANDFGNVNYCFNGNSMRENSRSHTNGQGSATAYAVGSYRGITAFVAGSNGEDTANDSDIANRAFHGDLA